MDVAISQDMVSMGTRDGKKKKVRRVTGENARKQMEEKKSIKKREVEQEEHLQLCTKDALSSKALIFLRVGEAALI